MRQLADMTAAASEDAARRRVAARAYYVANRERCLAYGRKYYAANAKKVCKRAMQWQRDNPERRDAYKRKWRYGTDGLAMLAGQDGRCGVCRCEFAPGRGARSKHLDHSHETGFVRGWLCKRCNVGLGHFGDSRSLLLAAAEYLRRADQRAMCARRTTSQP